MVKAGTLIERRRNAILALRRIKSELRAVKRECKHGAKKITQVLIKDMDSYGNDLAYVKSRCPTCGKRWYTVQELISGSAVPKVSKQRK